MKSCKDVPDRVCQESSIYLMTFIKHLISQKYYLIEIYLRQFPSENVPISRRNLVKPSPGTSATMSQRPSAARKKSFNSSRPALNFFNCCLQPSLINVGKEKMTWFPSRYLVSLASWPPHRSVAQSLSRIVARFPERSDSQSDILLFPNSVSVCRTARPYREKSVPQFLLKSVGLSSGEIIIIIIITC